MQACVCVCWYVYVCAYLTGMFKVMYQTVSICVYVCVCVWGGGGYVCLCEGDCECVWGGGRVGRRM